MGFHHYDGPYGHDWTYFLGGVIPLLLFAVLIGVAVWAVIRFTGRNRPMAATTGPALGPAPDGALEEVRLRYARGEISREEFVQRFRDLGGAEPPAPTPLPAEPG